MVAVHQNKLDTVSGVSRDEKMCGLLVVFGEYFMTTII